MKGNGKTAKTIMRDEERKINKWDTERNCIKIELRNKKKKIYKENKILKQRKKNVKRIRGRIREQTDGWKK